jgi:hypothetical protein
VQFLDGTSPLGTVAVSFGRALLSTSSLSIGSHVITAQYSGDTNDNSSTSAALTEVVSNPKH